MRTEYCGHIDLSHLGKSVRVCGWVNRRRDHGGIIFIDLRDREGIVQVVCNPSEPGVLEIANGVRSEYVLQITGVVRERPPDMVNTELRSGLVEIVANALIILNIAQTPPFTPDERVTEEIRLRYRFLDLRRPVMQKNLMVRHHIATSFRQFLNQHHFIDIETPMLTRSTPEGARDYLVPSRMQPGEFYALPQSPQLFKQLLMMSGFDRYYQIVKCFRDEDLRADRQPEFTQIDIETSFMVQHSIMALMEQLIVHVFKAVHIDLPTPFPTLSYDAALKKYGSDKPDVRVTLVLTDITDIVTTVSFTIFSAAAAQKDGGVFALRVPRGASMTRKDIDNLTAFVGTHGLKGLAWIKCYETLPFLETGDRSGLQSPIIKNIEDGALAGILRRTQCEKGDILFFGAGPWLTVCQSLGQLRCHIGHAYHHLTEKTWCPLWIIDFPLFTFDDTEKRWVSLHHPFTAPQTNDLEKLATAPQDCHAQAYDLVINGWEIGGGSVRIHDVAVQKQVLAILGLSEERSQKKFGFLLQALRYGAPPHGGIAFGLDRIVALVCQATSIRDVIAFPKTQRAQCLLTQSPNTVDHHQLKELGLSK